MVSSSDLLGFLNVNALRWNKFMETGKFDLAAKHAITSIREYCGIDIDKVPNGVRPLHHGGRVALNAFRDISNLMIIQDFDKWLDYPKLVEEAWGTAVDAEERLLSYTGFDVEFVEQWQVQIRCVFNDIDNRYGEGVYTSWETKWEKLICTICESEIRGCNHIPGEWYEGNRCLIEPVNPVPIAVAIVKNPVDRRCRIWPWLKRREEKGHVVIEGIPIFIITRPEGDEDGGSVVDIYKLIQSA